MTEQNKKGAQVVKRNTEKEQCLVYLEASLGISVTRFSTIRYNSWKRKLNR